MLYNKKDIHGTMITGASDDLIELYGDIYEEFSSYNCKKGHLALSDGTLLSVRYDEYGLWRFTPIIKGSLFEHIELGNVEKDINDKVFINPGLKWALFTEEPVAFAD